jgi:peptide/nickel transport system permease protein
VTQYIVRRLIVGFITLIAISFVIFAILELSPADPVGNLPLTIPPEVREQIRESMGVNDPFLIKYVKWVRQFFINEPLNILEKTMGIRIGVSADLVRGGTAIGTMGTVANGFDNNPDTQADITGTTGTLVYDFGVGNEKAVQHYTITVSAPPLLYVETAETVEIVEVAEIDAPQDWTFEYSDDGSTWSVVDTVTGENNWIEGQADGLTRTFQFSDVGSHRYWRINISNNNGGENLAIGEMEMMPQARLRYISWQTRSPIIDLVIQRTPQTLWVVGTAYILGTLLALPIGMISAYKQYSWFDQIGTFVAMVGFSVPTFFTGLIFIIIFSVKLKWFPSIYNTTLVVNDFDSFMIQLKQMFMPVMVLTLFYMAQLSRFTRSSMLDNLGQDYIRTARSKGLNERAIVFRHALRNSMIPVITLLALGIPGVFSGALITEQIFRVNGLGQLLITAIQGGDLPTVQTLTFIFAFLIVAFNIVADVLYGVLDPRVVYN